MDALNSIFIANALLHPMCNSKQVCEFHIARDSSDKKNYVLDFYAGTMNFLKIKFSSATEYIETVNDITKALEHSASKKCFSEKVFDEQQDGDEIEISINAYAGPTLNYYHVHVELNVLYIHDAPPFS